MRKSVFRTNHTYHNRLITRKFSPGEPLSLNGQALGDWDGQDLTHAVFVSHFRTNHTYIEAFKQTTGEKAPIGAIS